MSNLIHPITRQPCEFVASLRGYVALRLTCTVSPAIQWFSLAQIEAVNPVHTCAQPPQPLTVVLTPEMAASVNASAGVRIVVRKPASITVYHSAMREAA